MCAIVLLGREGVRAGATVSKKSVRRANAARHEMSLGPPARRPSFEAPSQEPVAVSSSPPSGVGQLSTPEEARSLAERLTSGSVRWPVVVVTTAAGQDTPFVPAARVAEEVSGFAEVVVLPTGDASWAFSRALPPLTQVYGGASRVYGPDRAWMADPYDSPLRFAFDPDGGERVADDLGRDAAAFAFAADQLAQVNVELPTASGTVLGVRAERGLVSLDDGGIAAVWAELTVSQVPIERLLTKGQRVTGVLDEERGRLDIRPMLDGRAEASPAGDVEDLSHVLVRVEDVGEGGVTVTLVPGFTVEVPGDRAGEDAVGDLFAVGDVVVGTWVVDGDPVLHLDLWTEDEPVARAASILPGGPPWLELAPPAANGGEAAQSAQAAQAAEQVEAPRFDPSDPVMVELMSLRRTVEEQRRKVEELRAERAELRRRARSSGAGRRRLRGDEDNCSGLGDAFGDPEEQLRFEVYLAWARRIPPSDKAARPLREYDVGPNFLTALHQLEGVSRSKVCDVIVEVLTKLAREIDGRDLHQLREGAGGGSGVVRREDGATCWRVALQRESASARRMHFWELPGDRVELSRVGLHDDVAA